MIEAIVQQFDGVGGPVLLALLLVSLAATTVSIYKLVQFASLGVGRHRAARAALAAWRAGDRDGAMRTASADGAALSLVAFAAMDSMARNPRSPELAREAAELQAMAGLNAMTAHLRILEAVVQAAPMLGLLGTVIGMIDAFGKLSEGGGAVDPAALAGGIWIALTTTAVGLGIAIPFYFLSTWLESRVEREQAAMEATIAGLLHGHPVARSSAVHAAGLGAAEPSPAAIGR